MATITDRKTGTKRAAIYARVSDKSQDTEEKTYISEQISDMEAHCERRGLTITARYQEVGRGWSKNRPEFQRMLADARKGRFDTIVCWKADRLSRGMYPAAALMEVIEAYQIDLEAVLDAIDMKTFGLMAAIGKIELDNFRERASMGKRGSAKQGRIPVNNVPFGYRLGEGRRPVVEESEAEVVRRVFHMYVREGMGGRVIAKQLTAEGVPTPRAVGKWLDGTVTRILKHEAYRGTWWFGKRRHVATEHGMRRYNRPEDEWVGVPFPPIVDDEIWEQAQEAKKRRLTRSGRNTKLFYLLQHLVRCAECGFLMGCRANRRQTTRRGGKVYRVELDPPLRYYSCYGMLNEGVRCREHPYIRAERLEAVVWSEVKKVLEDPGLIVASIEAMDSQAEGWQRRSPGLNATCKRSRWKRTGPSGSSCPGRSPRSSSTISESSSPSVWRRSGPPWTTTAPANRRRRRRGRWRSTSSSGRSGPETGWTACRTTDAGRCLSSFWTGRPSTGTTRST